MSETGQIILLVCILVLAFILTRKVNAWRIRQAYIFIIKDLESMEAFDPSSAVGLPYAKPSMFRMGMRDFRPKALEYMIVSNIIGMTEAGKYYLKNKDKGLFNRE